MNFNLKKFSLTSLVSLLLALPFTLAAEATDLQLKSISAALAGIAKGVKLILTGDIGGGIAAVLTQGLIQVLAVVAIVYSLMYFGISMIMKGDEHKKSRQLFSWGVALIALVFPGVFGLITGLFQGMIAIVIIGLFIVVIWFLVLRAKKQRHELSADSKTSQLKDAKITRDLEKEENELDSEKKLYFMEQDDLEAATNYLKNDNIETGTIEEIIKGIRNLLSKLGGETSSEAANNVRAQLMSKVAPLTGHIKRKREDILRVLKSAQKLDEATLKDLDFSKNEDEIYNDLKNTLKREYKNASHFSSTSEAEREISRYKTELGILIKKIKDFNTETETFVKDVEKVENEELRDDGIISRLVARLTEALTSGNQTEAINELNAVDAYLKRMSQVEKKVKLDLDKIRQLNAQKRKFESEMQEIENKILTKVNP